MQTAPFARPAPPWSNPVGLEAVLARWRQRASVIENVGLDARVAGHASRSASLPSELAPDIRSALSGAGIRSLYSHQAEAFEWARKGASIVVATPTASGKSMCYNLPVLAAFAEDPAATALYLFPTKALARDQEVSLRALLTKANLRRAPVVYDGDTSPSVRKRARDQSGLVMTNPDMLHSGILPHHTRWARFFAGLKYVVIDEMHMYRGVFGAHLANVLRRLMRIADFHGAAPQLLFSSATIGNPKEHAEQLSGRAVRLIDESGAPMGDRQVVVYNPPIVNAELGIRGSCTKAVVALAADLVVAGVSTLIFGQSRNQVEIILRYLRERVVRMNIDPASIQGYRGGYLPEARRRIEGQLRDGTVRCVVATNALELGIDVGLLEAVVLAGYPGNMASTWQRFGRGGRRQGTSLGLLVASSRGVDQYVAQHPTMILDAPIEEARTDPDNVDILLQHLKCAAFELPFQRGMSFGGVGVSETDAALSFLADRRVIRRVTNRAGEEVYHWSDEQFPANNVSLRGLGWDNFVIIDVEKEVTIGEMDYRSTHTMLHEQAIYQQDGETFQVERLDFENHKAFVRSVRPDYYTTAMTHVRVSVLAQDFHGDGDGTLQFGAGDVQVVERVVGYKKIKFNTHENVGYGEVNLPAMEKATTSFWIRFSYDLVSRIDAPRAVIIDALEGFARALKAACAVGLMMEPADLGTAVVDEPCLRVTPRGPSSPEAAAFEPTLYLYESVAGGVGLSERIFHDRRAAIQRALDLIDDCVCRAGCPSCIGPCAVDCDGLSSNRKRVLARIFERSGV